MAVLDENTEGDLLIGREQELALLRRWASSSSACLVIRGAVGVGKTALLASFAEHTAEDWDFIAKVSLAGTSASDLPHRVGRQLGLDTTRQGATERLGRVLEARGRGLLILDGVDNHDSATTEMLSGWMNAAPMTKMLVSTCFHDLLDGHESLQLRGLDPESSDSPAVRLFQRELSRAGVEGQPDADLVAELASLLEGHPMALSMAATSVAVDGLVQVVHELRHDLSVGPSDRLRASFERCWATLAEQPREDANAASCFASTFSVKEATEIFAEGESVTDRLRVLQRASLLTPVLTADGKLSYRMHSVIRRLIRDGDPSKHAQHEERYIAYAVDTIRSQPGDPQSTNDSEPALSRDEVLHAWRRALVHAQSNPSATRTSRALHMAKSFDLATLPSDTLVALLDQTATLPGARELEGWSEVQVRRATCLRMSGALDAAQEQLQLLSESSIAEGVLGDAIWTELTLWRYYAAKADADQPLRAWRERRSHTPGDEQLAVEANTLGMVAYRQGSYVEALDQFESSATLAQRSDQKRAAWYLANLGLAQLSVGALEPALAALRAAVEAANARSDVGIAAYARAVLGQALLLKNPPQALECYEIAVPALRQLGWQRELANCLVGYGCAARACGELDRAISLFREAADIADPSSPKCRTVALARAGAAAAHIGLLTKAESQFADAETTLVHCGESQEIDAVLQVERTHLWIGRERRERADPTRQNQERGADGETHASDLLARAREVIAAIRNSPVASHDEVKVSLLAIDPMISEAQTQPKLTVGPELQWFAVGESPPVDCRRRHIVRKILGELLTGSSWTTTDELAERIYPDIRWESARNRLYVAINQLRKLGLSEVLENSDQGYRLAADISTSTDPIAAT